MDNFEEIRTLGIGGFGQDRRLDFYLNREVHFWFLEVAFWVIKVDSLRKATLVRSKQDRKLFVIKEINIAGMTDIETKEAMKEVEILKKVRNLTKHIVE